MGDIYSTDRWRQARARALARDGRRCTVAWLLSGSCTDDLQVHHIVPLSEGGAAYDLSNLGTVCSRHHPIWENLRRTLVRRRGMTYRRCPHQHRTPEGRRLCEERLNRERVAA